MRSSCSLWGRFSKMSLFVLSQNIPEQGFQQIWLMGPEHPESLSNVLREPIPPPRSWQSPLWPGVVPGRPGKRGRRGFPPYLLLLPTILYRKALRARLCSWLSSDTSFSALRPSAGLGGSKRRKPQGVRVIFPSELFHLTGFGRLFYFTSLPCYNSSSNRSDGPFCPC